jgi:ActR/RegA family two-component response regulator
VTVARGGRQAGRPRVLVLADDLIWATRLVGQLRTVGADPVRVGSADSFAAALAAPATAGPGDVRPTHAVVDLTARAYDGLAAVRLAVAAGLRVLCVGQHDDHAHRRAALTAGADRVFAYRRLFEDGHATLAAWLGVPAPAAGSLTAPPSSEVPAR